MKSLNSSITQYKPNKESVRRLNREIKIRRKLAIPPDSFSGGEDRLIKSMPEHIE